MSDLHFLPHLRRGLSTGIDLIDPLSGSLPRETELEAWVTVEGRRIPRRLTLHGPEAVAELGADQVLRCEPQPDSSDVEPNYFALIELAAPDLPWLFTPAAADDRGRLRPWLVLIVVRRQEGVRLSTRTTTRLRVLTIEPPAVPALELPDLTDSWAWAHVQSTVESGALEAAVANSEPTVLARILSPRRLVADSAWYACLVPAFAHGVTRGLGEDPPADGGHVPAWVAGAEPERIDLPVYHSWSFQTGARGDFEALCRRLEPDTDGAQMGLHALDITDPGLVPAAGHRILLDMEGALVTPGAESRVWRRVDRESFQTALEPLVNASLTHGAVTDRRGGPYDPASDDPILAPPVYGAGPAGVEQVPRRGWLRPLNLHPVQRAMAGLGAATVRSRQEELVAAAWDQAGDLAAAQRAVTTARLSAEIGESWARRVRELPDGDALQATTPIHALLSDGRQSVRERVVASAAPTSIFSPAYARRTRPGTALFTAWRERVQRSAARLTADHVGTVVAATRSDAPESALPALSFARYVLPHGAQTSDPTLPSSVTAAVADLSDLSAARAKDLAAVVSRRIGRDPPAALDPRIADLLGEPRARTSSRHAGERRTERLDRTSAISLTDVAATVRDELAPQAAVRAALVARTPGLEDLLGPEAGIPVLRVVPVFDDPLYWDLLALGVDWILPGVQALRRNRVRLLGVNRQFVGSYLIGANSELARELRWRDYPVDDRGTFFHRFWQYVDADRTDITDLDGWALEESLLENMDDATDDMTALVVRADLVQRYPSAHWFLQEAVEDGAGAWGPGGSIVEPAFLGSLDPNTALYGFDVRPADVRGDRPNGVGGWFVAVEERLTAPRFGLDTARRADFKSTPTTTADLSWGHLVASRSELEDLTHARATGTRLDDVDMEGTVWGRNAAHVAAATWQRPFRLYVHADLLF